MAYPPGKKGGLGLLLIEGKGKEPPDSDDSGEPGEDEYKEDLVMVMEDFINAVKGGKAAAAASAFKAAHRICARYSESEGDEGME